MNLAAALDVICFRSRCNCSCFCTDDKYGRYMTLGDKLDTDHLRSEVKSAASLITFSHALRTFIRDEVETWFRLTQDSYLG